jgi:hypothetical protein
MDSANSILTQLVNALPLQFDFYHLGKVEQQTFPFELKNMNGVAFRIYGDLNALMIVLFDKDLDHTVYSELGNLLASSLVTRIHQEKGIDLMISPPQAIQHGLLEQVLQQMISNAQPIIRRTYTHVFKNSIIPVETLVLSVPSEESGYA